MVVSRWLATPTAKIFVEIPLFRIASRARRAAFEDLARVVLHPAGLRKDLAELALPDGDRTAASSNRMARELVVPWSSEMYFTENSSRGAMLESAPYALPVTEVERELLHTRRVRYEATGAPTGSGTSRRTHRH